MCQCFCEYLYIEDKNCMLHVYELQIYSHPSLKGKLIFHILLYYYSMKDINYSKFQRF